MTGINLHRDLIHCVIVVRFIYAVLAHVYVTEHQKAT